MKHIHSLIFVFFITIQFCIGQESISEVLTLFNTESIPYISVEELALEENKIIILDAREIREYEVSHVKGAINVGYDNFDISKILNTIKDKNKKIVVYCTLGVRSEDIAEKLKASGYTNVFNLFGGIFEWKNNDYNVFNSEEKQTENVHICNEYWSKWLTKGKKVYE